jgi:hypothetical protein
MKRSPIKRRSKTDLAKLKEKLWQLCRKIVKLLYPHVCYTCGKPLIDGSNDFHTGHFIPSSICSTVLRYLLDNLRPQCSGCNVWKSGNWLAFENHLIKDLGKQFVADLKKLNQETKGKKYDVLWYQMKIEEYEAIYEKLQAKLNEL